IAAAVEPVHDGLIRSVPTFVAKANQVQRDWRGNLKASILAHPAGKLLRELHVAADMMLEALNAVVPDHKPQFERAETPAELDVPVAVVNHRTRFRGLIAQKF